MDDKAVVSMLGNAIVDTVRDVHPLPAPEGPMYMAFNAAGGSIDLFMKMVDALVAVGRLKRSGSHCLVLGPKELS